MIMFCALQASVDLQLAMQVYNNHTVCCIPITC